MKEIILTKGQIAVVDDEDWERLIYFRWHLIDTRGMKYARRHFLKSEQKTGGEYMHRAILTPPTGLFVDHLNGNGLDNRRVNLRLATTQENGRNRKRATNNRSGKTGVYFRANHNRWYADIKIGGKKIALGTFERLDDAVAARIEAEKQYGFYAR